MTRGDGEGNTYGEVYHYRPRHLERGDKITPAAETGNVWARLEHERFLSTQTAMTGSSTDPDPGPAKLLTYMAAKQKPRSLRLGWSEKEGSGVEFSGAAER